MVGKIINLIYPASCQLCETKTRAWDQNLCNDCLKKIKKRLPPFCLKCGRQLPGEPEMQDICIDCKKDNLYFDRVFSVFYYDEAFKKLVHNFKYKKITGLTKEFVEWTLAFMKEYNIGKESNLIMSIPMHPARLFIRELNPSHILAKNIAKKTGIQYSGSLLKKIKNTTAQSKLKRQKRLENIKNSFSIEKKASSMVFHKRILLVDDLFTTGSTVNECARILKAQGASYVEVITLARGDRLS